MLECRPPKASFLLPYGARRLPSSSVSQTYESPSKARQIQLLCPASLACHICPIFRYTPIIAAETPFSKWTNSRDRPVLFCTGSNPGFCKNWPWKLRHPVMHFEALWLSEGLSLSVLQGKACFCQNLSKASLSIGFFPTRRIRRPLFLHTDSLAFVFDGIFAIVNQA